MNLYQLFHNTRGVKTVLFMVTLFSIVFVILLALKDSNQKEGLLIAWGVQHNSSSNCFIWIVDPENKTSSSLAVAQEDCDYEIVKIGGQEFLAKIVYPGQITIYKITSKREILVQQTINIGNWGFSSIPQWGLDGKIYFSSTVNDVEQIYRADIPNREVVPFINYEGGLATEPIISPDGHYLVYWTLDGPTNQQPRVCGLECNGYYHIFDIPNQTDIYLLPLLESLVSEPLFAHCNAQWSPTGQYLAFSIGGCGSFDPQNVVVFDTKTNQIMVVLKSDVGQKDQFVSLKGWLSETEIVYGKRFIFPEMNFDGEHFYVYSLTTHDSRELLNAPTQTENRQEFILAEPSWTLGGKQIVATMPTISSSGQLNKDLAIIDHENRLSQISYLYEDENVHQSDRLSFNRPAWSPSGSWITYYSTYKEQEDSSEWLVSLYLIDKTGSITVNTGVVNVLESSLHYTWILP